MADKRLIEYLLKKGYIKDFTNGGIATSITSKSKALPLIIGGKCVIGPLAGYQELSLEEFLLLEPSLYCVEGDGGFDDGEGADAGEGDVLGLEV